MGELIRFGHRSRNQARRVDVRPQLVRRDVGEFGDGQDALGGDSGLLPSQNGGFVDAKAGAELLKGQPDPSSKGAKLVFGVHGLGMLRITQRMSRPPLREPVTTTMVDLITVAAMARPTRIHKDKFPIRFHYIPEWAARRKLKQADIVRELASDVNKSTVSRWFSGVVPAEAHLIALTELFAAGEPAALFRHPDDDWIARFFRDRSPAERDRALRLLKAIDENKAA